MANARVPPNGMDLEAARLVRDVVDVHGPVAALCSDVFIQRVPGDTLDVMVVLRDFVHALACEVVSDTLGTPQER